MKSEDIVREIDGEADCFKPRVPKHTGAIAVDIIKEQLGSVNWIDEAVDIYDEVFVQGNSSQFDLVMVKKGAARVTHRCFKPNDVLAVLEVKYNGNIRNLRETPFKKFMDSFTIVSKEYTNICCIYLTIHESGSIYKKDFNGYLGTAFYLYTGSGKRKKFTDDWEQLLKVLKNHIEETAKG